MEEKLKNDKATPQNRSHPQGDQDDMTKIQNGNDHLAAEPKLTRNHHRLLPCDRRQSFVDEDGSDTVNARARYAGDNIAVSTSPNSNTKSEEMADPHSCEVTSSWINSLQININEQDKGTVVDIQYDNDEAKLLIPHQSLDGLNKQGRRTLLNHALPAYEQMSIVIFRMVVAAQADPDSPKTDLLQWVHDQLRKLMRASFSNFVTISSWRLAGLWQETLRSLLFAARNGHSLADVNLLAIPPPFPDYDPNAVCFQYRDWVFGVWPPDVRDSLLPVPPPVTVQSPWEDATNTRMNLKLWVPSQATPLELTGDGLQVKSQGPLLPSEIYGGPNCFVQIANKLHLSLPRVEIDRVTNILDSMIVEAPLPCPPRWWWCSRKNKKCEWKPKRVRMLKRHTKKTNCSDDSPRKPQIFVKTPTNETLTFEFDDLSDTTVEEVKVKIQERNRWPPDEQRLLFLGKMLLDNETLSNYNIQRDCTIHPSSW